MGDPFAAHSKTFSNKTSTKTLLKKKTNMTLRDVRKHHFEINAIKTRAMII